jgi:hypothetical protein
MPFPPLRRSPPAEDPADFDARRTRPWSGLWLLAGGDVAIAVSAILCIVAAEGARGTSPTVPILASALTAIGTMTTACLGLRSMSNAAQSCASGPVRAKPRPIEETHD